MSIEQQTAELTEFARYWSRKDTVEVTHRPGLFSNEPGKFMLEWYSDKFGKICWDLCQTFEKSKELIERWFRFVSVVGSFVKGYDIDPDPRPRSLYFPYDRIGSR